MARHLNISSALLLIVAASIVNFSNAVDYCQIKSCPNRSQTVCQFQSPQPSSRCTGYRGSGLTSNEKWKIVNLHNELRKKVASGNERRGISGGQPAAKYMPSLVWDYELAYIAQRWADQCNWGHDKCRNVNRFYVGQNIAVIGTTGDANTIKVESMVESWYNEVKDFNKNDVLHFRAHQSPMIGHYTQMIWAKTTRIGCGATKYKDGKFNKFYLVCNYGPGGNIIGQPIYETR